MIRWSLFLCLNYVGWLCCAFLLSPIKADEPFFALKVAVVASLGFPLSPLALLIPLRDLAIAIVTINPFLWATMVECLFRRFVERPKDSSSE